MRARERENANGSGSARRAEADFFLFAAWGCTLVRNLTRFLLTTVDPRIEVLRLNFQLGITLDFNSKMSLAALCCLRVTFI